MRHRTLNHFDPCLGDIFESCLGRNADVVQRAIEGPHHVLNIRRLYLDDQILDYMEFALYLKLI